MSYLLVILLVVIAAFVFWKGGHSWVSRRHKARRDQARRFAQLLGSGSLLPAQAFAYLRKINPFTFEELVLDGFERAGYLAVRNRRYSGDGGVDGRVIAGGKEYLVQCKRYRGYVSRQDVEDFSRVCTRLCRDGFFVHTGKTGNGSTETAQLFGNVTIVSGDSMLDLVGFKGANG